MNGSFVPTDVLGKPLPNLSEQGFTSTILEPLRGSCGLPYTGGVLTQNFRTTAFIDAPGTAGAGRYAMAEGEANFTGGRVDANTAYWIYALACDIVEMTLNENGDIIGQAAPIDNDLAARIAGNLLVTFYADGQNYDLGYLIDYLSASRAGTAAQGQGFTHDNKIGWPGLRDDKVPFALNPGNSFNISLTAIRTDDISGNPATDRLFVVRWWLKGPKWLQGGAAQKR